MLQAPLACLALSCGHAGNAHHASVEPAQTPFLAAVSAVCARAVEAHTGHPFPVRGFDPEHPDPDQLPTVGTYFTRYGGLPETPAALHALPMPASDADTWRDLLLVVDQIQDDAQRQISAARSKDVAAFVATVHTPRRLTDALDTKGARFGFTSNSPCHQVFG